MTSACKKRLPYGLTLALGLFALVGPNAICQSLNANTASVAFVSGFGYIHDSNRQPTKRRHTNGSGVARVNGEGFSQSISLDRLWPDDPHPASSNHRGHVVNRIRLHLQ
jgi:hypothetical protein